MKTCLSEGKLMEQFGNPPPPLFLSNFFITPLFVQISKTRNPSPLIVGGEDTMWSVFPCIRTNSFVLAHSSAKKIKIKQLTVKSSIQWYHMTLI